jgi:hypothetical protein
MIHPIQQMRETSLAFRHALLRSEKKRIFGVIAFVCFFAVLAIVRIFVLGSAMSRWGLMVAALVIAFELGLYRAVNRSLLSGKDISNFARYVSSVLECLFPAIGVAFLASTRILPDYRPLATPWVLAFFPFMLLSVLRLNPKLCWGCGIVTALGYLAAAHVTGWHFSPGPSGFTVTQTAVKYFAFVLLITGGLAAVVIAISQPNSTEPSSAQLNSIARAKRTSAKKSAQTQSARSAQRFFTTLLVRYYDVSFLLFCLLSRYATDSVVGHS